LRLCVEQAIVGVTVQDAAEGEHDDEPETLIDGGTDRRNWTEKFRSARCGHRNRRPFRAPLFDAEMR